MADKKTKATLIGQFETLPIETLIPSDTNPRKHFDDKQLEDLAASIKAKGILEPLLIRSLDGGDGACFEIVAGERRYRAAKEARLGRIPCIIRDMTDKEVIETQIIENMHREDLTPFEEAEGYQALHEKYKYDWAELAARTGKSQEYVYTRLKLLKLIPEFQKQLQAGELKLKQALLITRIQDPEDQKQLLKAQTSKGWIFDPKDTDDLKDWIENNCLLQLSKAPFPIKDKTLTGKPCAECTRRSGAHPDLFGDLTGKKDTCQDNKCWAEKKKKFEVKVKSKFKHYADAGHELIVGAKAEMILGSSYGAFEKPTENSNKLKGNITWEQAIKGTSYKPAIVVSAKGKAHERIRTSAALKVVPKSKKYSCDNGYSNTPQQQADREREQRRKEIKKNAAWTAAAEALETIKKQTTNPFSFTIPQMNGLIRIAVLKMVESHQVETDERADKIFGFKDADRITVKSLKLKPMQDVFRLFVLMICGDPFDYSDKPTEAFKQTLNNFELTGQFDKTNAAELKRLKGEDLAAQAKAAAGTTEPVEKKTKKKGGTKAK